VQAVLDWELSTLGDPTADFTYLLLQWIMPGLAGLDLKALNIPAMEEAAQIYCSVTNIAMPQPVPPRGHRAGYRGEDPRRHRCECESHRIGQAHGAVVKVGLGIRAKVRRNLKKGTISRR
jgi:hypothetical protein